MNASFVSGWIDANQHLVTAELARLKVRLGAEGNAQALEAAACAARDAMPAPAAIDRLAAGFGLSTFERDVLLLCAGVEMDAQIAAQCDAAGGDVRRQGPSFGLALAALAAPHWSALAPGAPLRSVSGCMCCGRAMYPARLSRSTPWPRCGSASRCCSAVPCS